MNLYGTGACVQRKTSATENKQPKRSGTLYFKTDTATQHLQQNSGVIEKTAEKNVIFNNLISHYNDCVYN